MTVIKSLRLPHLAGAMIAAFVGTAQTPSAQAEIDGHGPDAWRVTGVAATDRLNARMGPGVEYPVIESFAHDERGLQQITCVPFYTAAHFTAMTADQIRALPPRWCLMRDRAMSKAGWVAQRYITPDDTTAASEQATDREREMRASQEPSIDPLIVHAEELVRDLYARYARAESRNGPDPLSPPL